MTTSAEMLTPKLAKPQSHRMSSLGIRGRLLIGFGAITFIFLIAIGITSYIISNNKQLYTRVILNDLPTYDSFLDLHSAILKGQAAIEGWIITNDQKYKSDLQNSWNHIDQIESTIDNLSKHWINDSYAKYWQDIKSTLAQLKVQQENILNSPSMDKKDITNALIHNINPLADKLSLSFNTFDNTNASLLDIQSKQLHKGTQQVINNINKLQIIQYALAFLGITMAITIAILTSRAILYHVNIFRQHSNRIASGDLTKFIDIESDDELGQLGNDLNVMTNSLAIITKQIAQDCNTMVAALEEVRHVVDSQSSGASEQASSINEITASVSEIEKSASQTMEKAKVLGEAAERTREKGQMGLNAVEQSVQGMKAVKEKVQTIAQTILDLSNQTQQVGEITAVVNNLAQQSKMLALNASIEAAKAGEAGKGFSVVAIEVKNLAEQSEQSTAQVQKILEDIRHATEKAVMVTEEGTKGVDQGTSLVEQTGEIIRNLNDVIHETTIATQQIEAAVRQESAGIEQINIGMNEINQVTATFVESVKQTTEAIGNLANIAKNLKKYVETYKI